MAVCDSLLAAGPRGWDLATFYRKVGLSSKKAQVEALETVLELHLGYEHGGRIYARENWVRDIDPELG